VLLDRLATAERHLAEGAQRILHQHEIVTELEGRGRSNSQTSAIARELLYALERAERAQAVLCDRSAGNGMLAAAWGAKLAQNQDDLSTTLRNARPAAKARQLSAMIWNRRSLR